jgi:hypothetical protein
MFTETFGLSTRGRSKGTGGTERARLTLTVVEVMLARLWKGEVEKDRGEGYR